MISVLAITFKPFDVWFPDFARLCQKLAWSAAGVCTLYAQWFKSYQQNIEYVSGTLAFTPCTCTDGCVDRTKCECALRTKEIFDNSSKKWARNIRSDNTNSATPLGYKNRKLLESSDDAMAHRIGLFECSPECTCMNQMKYNNPCENRVVQCGIRQVLYLELMPIKGWGVRTRYDIPKGTFISTYWQRFIYLDSLLEKN